MSRRVLLAVALLVLGSVMAGTGEGPLRAAPAPYQSFSTSSYWNTPLCSSAPVDDRSADMIAWLRSDNTAPFVKLAGAQSNGGWGNPIFWTDTDDPVYNVVRSKYALPPEFASLRIPLGAQPSATTDAELTVYDLAAGGVAHLWRANYDGATYTWSAGGGAYYYLTSNGLHGSLPESDGPRNTGHRGVPPPVHTVRWDEVQAGSIDHVLKIAVNTARQDHVFPMVGSDGNSADLNAPPEGARIRINPSVDLTQLGLSPAALVIARALQRYGAVIGDQSGGAVTLKLENTVAESRGNLWDGVLDADSLSAIPLDSFEFIQLGYDPTRSPGCTTSVTFPAASDAHVVRRRAHTNFGTRGRVRVVGPRRSLGLLKFNVTGIDDASRAVLRLHSRTGMEQVTLHTVVSNSWSEKGVTWSRAPRVGRVLASSGPATRDSWVELDVTAALAGPGKYSFALTTRSSIAAVFDSKEAGSGRGAELVVTGP